MGFLAKIFRYFSGARLLIWKFSDSERKRRISTENVFSGLSKAHFKCPVQHFEKKVIKVKFTFCGLFRTACVFFCSGRKINQGFQNHKLSVQRKNLGRIFLTQVLFQNIFLILSGKTWSFSGKWPAWLSNLDFMGTTEHFQSNVFEASL